MRRGTLVTVTLPSPNRLSCVLAAVVGVLIAASLAGQTSKHVFGYGSLKGLVPLFYVDQEANIPTWYSSAALMLAAVLLGALAHAKSHCRQPYFAWLALALLFVLLSVDEIAGIHEYPIEPLRTAWHAHGIWYYTWVIPGLAFVALVGAGFARFLGKLPRRTRNAFLLAGAVFVGGAICVEMASGWWADRHGEENLTYALIVTLEEALEMLGVVIFIRAVALELRETVPELVLCWRNVSAASAKQLGEGN